MFKKNIFLAFCLGLLVANSYSMKRERDDNNSDLIPTAQSSSKKQKTESAPKTPEEQFVVHEKKITSDVKKLTALKIVIKELLAQPNNKFYRKIIEAITDQAKIDASSENEEIEKADLPSSWKKQGILRMSSKTVHGNSYVLQADDNMYNPGKQIKLLRNNQEIAILNAKGKVNGVKFCGPSGDFAISLAWDKDRPLSHSFLELWDLRDKAQLPNNNITWKKSIAQIENWADTITILGYDPAIKFIYKGPNDKWYVEPFKNKPENKSIYDYLSKEILHADLTNLYGKTTRIKQKNGDTVREIEEPTGPILYLLINEILEYHDKTAKPFEISSSKLKRIFNELPPVVKNGFIDLGYVQLH